MSSFAAKDQPVIFWTPDYGAVIVRGAMNAAWQKLGGATGSLGAPMADQTENGEVITQRFSGGVVSWDRSKNTFSTEPPNLASAAGRPAGAGTGCAQGSRPLTRRPQTPTATSGSAWSWWWLLAIIPVLVLAGLVAVAALRNRRRGGDDELVDTGDDGSDHDASPSYDAVPATGGNPRRTITTPRRRCSVTRYSGEGRGSRPTPAAGAFGPANVWGAPGQRRRGRHHEGASCGPGDRRATRGRGRSRQR